MRLLPLSELDSHTENISAHQKAGDRSHVEVAAFSGIAIMLGKVHDGSG